jgi:hypothetical protein
LARRGEGRLRGRGNEAGDGAPAVFEGRLERAGPGARGRSRIGPRQGCHSVSIFWLTEDFLLPVLIGVRSCLSSSLHPLLKRGCFWTGTRGASSHLDSEPAERAPSTRPCSAFTTATAVHREARAGRVLHPLHIFHRHSDGCRAIDRLVVRRHRAFRRRDR